MTVRPIIGFAGVTHLGVVSAAASAELGFETRIFGEDAVTVDRLRAASPPFTEPQLPELLQRNAERLIFGTDPAALSQCHVVFIAADVPTDASGASDLGPISALVERVRPVLGPEANFVMLSQVPPGFTRTLGLPEDRCFYQVETLIFGQAVARALSPERQIIGMADPDRRLPEPYSKFLAAFDCPILPMAYESAELAKIAINCCLVATLTTANTLAELCERIGADWRAIAGALRLDKRIGPHAYLNPGLGLGGGNLERDLVTVQRLAEREGTDAGIVSAWRANSARRRGWVLQTVRERVLRRWPRPLIAVLGLAYKADTDSVRNSPAMALWPEIGAFDVRAHDPIVSHDATPGVRRVDTVEAAMVDANALLVMTPWPEYRKLTPIDIARALRGGVVVDPWGVLDGKAIAAEGVTYCTLGAPALGPDFEH